MNFDESVDSMTLPTNTHDHSSLAARLGTVAAAGALVSACGGGSGGGSSGGDLSASGSGSGAIAVSEPVKVVQASSEVQAARFLAQATMGANTTDIAKVQSLGLERWLDEQFAMPRAVSHWDWLMAKGFYVEANAYRTTGFDQTMWRQPIVEPDQLRQRVGLALLDFLVVGIDGLRLFNFEQFATAAYVDILLNNAFGNYRQLLSAITTNAAMASFLTMLGNKKASRTTGAQPDENYAREMLQLFTLGPVQLNMDGSPKMSGSVALETYTQADITQIARIFTGLVLTTDDATKVDRYRQPLVINAAWNETGPTTVFGTTVSGGGMAAIEKTLDIVFAHANMPPFVSRQLIQRMVTSNPSPGYIGRVAAVFADNGKGVRGDLKAVVRAILLDPEARGDEPRGGGFGKVKEPVLVMTALVRAIGLQTDGAAMTIRDTALGQPVFQAPSVFNFYPPDYPLARSSGLVSPASKLWSAGGTVAIHNLVYDWTIKGEPNRGDWNFNNALDNTSSSANSAPLWSGWEAVGGDVDRLVAVVNLLMLNNSATEAQKQALRNAALSITNTDAQKQARRRAQALLYIAATSPNFLVDR